MCAGTWLEFQWERDCGKLSGHVTTRQERREWSKGRANCQNTLGHIYGVQCAANYRSSERPSLSRKSSEFAAWIARQAGSDLRKFQSLSSSSRLTAAEVCRLTPLFRHYVRWTGHPSFPMSRLPPCFSVVKWRRTATSRAGSSRSAEEIQLTGNEVLDAPIVRTELFATVSFSVNGQWKWFCWSVAVSLGRPRSFFISTCSRRHRCDHTDLIIS